MGAPLGRRVVAFVLDVMAARLVCAEILRLLVTYVGFSEGRFLFMTTLFLSVPSYLIFWEARTGTTPGKLLLGLQVASADTVGSWPSVRQCFLRRAPLLAGMLGAFHLNEWSYLAVVVALFITVCVAVDSRGWHDHLAGTVVVARRRHPAHSP